MCFFVAIVALKLLIVFSAGSYYAVPQSAGTFPEEFPLSINLNRAVFLSGEKIEFISVITNNSGRDAIIKTNGYQPCANAALRPFDHLLNHAEVSMLKTQLLRDGESLEIANEFRVLLPGVYTIDVHYSIDMLYGTSPICNESQALDFTKLNGKLDAITIVVI